MDTMTKSGDAEVPNVTSASALDLIDRGLEYLSEWEDISSVKAVMEAAKAHRARNRQDLYEGGYSDRGSERSVKPMSNSSDGATPSPPTTPAQQEAANGIHLRVSTWAKEHPQVLMRNYGITYQHATPQSMGDQWWFWNCANVPDELPEHFTILDLDPMKAIGHGLTRRMAKKIRDRQPITDEDHVWEG